MPSLASTVREELVQQLDDFSARLIRTRDELLRQAEANRSGKSSGKTTGENPGRTTLGVDTQPS